MHHLAVAGEREQIRHRVDAEEAHRREPVARRPTDSGEQILRPEKVGE